MSFFILMESTDSGETWVPQLNIRYDTGAEAQAKAKENNARYKRLADTYPKGNGYNHMRCRVRKMVDTDNDNFYAREAAKNHAPVPWDLTEKYAKTYMQDWHLPHSDPDKEHHVRFYSRIDDAIEDKYTTMRLSRFLNRFTGFGEDRISEILVAAGVYAGSEFGIATSAEDIQHVYEHGPSSCMNDPDDYSLQTDPHPVAVYGDSDFAVAYIKNGDEYSARAVVVPSKLIYYSGYGHTTLLFEKLKEAGYTRSTNYRDYYGLKLRAIRDNDGEWLMPYVDCAGSADLDADESFFITGSGDYEIQCTEGYAYYNDSSYYEEDY